MKYDKSYALSKLVPTALWTIHDDVIVEWNSSDITQPTEEEIQAKIAELQAAEPLRLLRIERNKLLAETDWMALNDVIMSDAWKTYRQALRDLPSTANPQLNENGQLTNVVWPTKPEN